MECSFDFIAVDVEWLTKVVEFIRKSLCMKGGEDQQRDHSFSVIVILIIVGMNGTWKPELFASNETERLAENSSSYIPMLNKYREIVALIIVSNLQSIYYSLIQQR